MSPQPILLLNMDDTDEWVSHFTPFFPNLTIRSYKEPGLLRYIQTHRPHAIILSGSSHRILTKRSATLPKKLLSLTIPILGICYGYEWLVKHSGGTIHTSPTLQKYEATLEIQTPFYVPPHRYKWNHYDSVVAPPPEWVPDQTHAPGQALQMAYHPTKRFLGVQFHPEKHKASGKAFFKAWLNWLSLPTQSS